MEVTDVQSLPHKVSLLEITEQDETQEEDASRGETGLTSQEFERWRLQQEFKLKELEIRTGAEAEARVLEIKARAEAEARQLEMRGKAEAEVKQLELREREMAMEQERRQLEMRAKEMEYRLEMK